LLEALAYIAFALAIPRASNRSLVLFALASAMALTYAVSSGIPLVHVGVNWSTLPPGVARLGFSFTVGVLLWRTRSGRLHKRRVTWLAWLPVPALGVLMMQDPGGESLVPLLILFAAIPALVGLATSWELPTPLLGKKIGNISYPLYCIHVPLLAWSASASLPPSALAVALVLTALAVDRWVDRPARKWLASRYVRGESSADRTQIRRASA
jgi:hypothetical protein